MMLDGLRHFLFGQPISSSGLDGIPQDTRDAHHRLRNTAMNWKRASREIDTDADNLRDLLELLARDIKRMGGSE